MNHLRLQLLRKVVGEDEHLTSKSKVDLSRLRPCYSAFVPHLQRVNHRVALFKRAHVSILEKPEPFEVGQGWTKTEEGTLEPIWSSGPILPASLVDLLDSTNPDEEQSDDNEDGYFDDFSDSDNDDWHILLIVAVCQNAIVMRHVQGKLFKLTSNIVH